MEKSKYILWNNRKSLQIKGILPSIVMLLILAVLSALSAKGFGGMLLMGVSGALFGYFLVIRRDLIPWLSVAFSFGIATALTGSILYGAASLLYVPMGIILAYAFFTERSLNVTVAALAAVLCASMAIYLCMAATELYNAPLRQSLGYFAGEIEVAFREAFSLFSYKGADGEIYHLSDEDISVLIEAAVMILPAFLVLTGELFAYVTAKVFHRAAKRLSAAVLLEERKWEVTLSLPMAIVFILAFGVSTFFAFSSVVYYSAMNISYILMPAAAIVGFKKIFMKGGLIRSRISPSSRTFLIILSAVSAFLAPLTFAQFLSVYAAVMTIAAVIFTRSAKKSAGEDERGE